MSLIPQILFYILILFTSTSKRTIPLFSTPLEICDNAIDDDGDGDDKNEVFSIFGSEDLREVSQLQIFNRWGNLMYEGTTLVTNEGWNGLTNGEKAPEVTYIYQAKILMGDGQEREVKGAFVLVR